MKFAQKKWVSLVFGKVYKNCPKIKKKCFFTKLTSKGVILTQNDLFCPMIRVLKFGPKKWWSLVLGKVYENCLIFSKKVLYYETYIEESNINQKPLIWSDDKIVTKFGQKKWVSLVFGMVYKNSPKIKKKCYFTKLASKGVILTQNDLFGPMIR